MTRDELTTAVIETMNLLEHQYDIADLENLGSPTVTEIVEAIMAEHFADATR